MPQMHVTIQKLVTVYPIYSHILPRNDNSAVNKHIPGIMHHLPQRKLHPSWYIPLLSCIGMHNYSIATCLLGVYKQWTRILEWWNSEMVNWIVFILIFIVCHIISTLFVST